MESIPGEEDVIINVIEGAGANQSVVNDDMVTFEQLIDDPYGSLDKIFDQEFNTTECSWYDSFLNRVETTIMDKDRISLARIPCVNAMNLREMERAEGRIVRFRVMIKESTDPQMFQPVVWVTNAETKQITKRCLVFRDLENIQLSNIATVNKSAKLRSLETFHGTFVPGENSWMSKFDKGLPVVESDDDEDFDFFESQNRITIELEYYPYDDGMDLWENMVFRFSVFRPTDIKINDVVEFFGILGRSEKKYDLVGSRADIREIVTELCFEGFPAVEKTFQVLAYRKDCSNISKFPKLALLRIDQPALLNEADTLRTVLKNLIKDCLWGDNLAAEYTMCNLLSEVVERVDGQPIGAMPLHLTSLPSKSASTLKATLSQLLEKSVKLMDILSVLGDSTFRLRPTKCHEKERLSSSVLQLSSGTHLILEEGPVTPTVITKLRCSNNAKRDVQTLKSFIAEQSLAYDYGFGTEINFPFNVPVLILSKTFSEIVVPASQTTVVVLTPAYDEGKFTREVAERIKELLEQENLLRKLRDFIIVLKGSEYFQIDAELNETICSDFVNSQNQNQVERRMNKDDLHKCLTLSGLWAKFNGFETMDLSIWKTVREMEISRKARLTNVHQDVTEQISNLRI